MTNSPDTPLSGEARLRQKRRRFIVIATQLRFIIERHGGARKKLTFPGLQKFT